MKEGIEIPKFLPVKCPVCNGFGTISFKKNQCHACKGRGFIFVPNGVYEEWVKEREKNGKRMD